MRCGWCGSTDVDYETVHNGVGYQQVTAGLCGTCGATEIDVYNTPEATPEERLRGWYKGEASQELANPWPMDFDVKPRRVMYATGSLGARIRVMKNGVVHEACARRNALNQPLFLTNCEELFRDGFVPDDDVVTCLACLAPRNC